MVDYNHLNGVNGNGSASKNGKKEKESVLTDPPEEEQGQQIMIDYEGERKMLL